MNRPTVVCVFDIGGTTNDGFELDYRTFFIKMVRAKLYGSNKLQIVDIRIRKLLL